jgi:signal peptidase II
VSRTAGWARAGTVLVAVLVADQLTKAIAVGAVPRGGREDFALGIDLVNVRNRGIAFGALQDGGAIVAVIVLAALAALVAFFARHATQPLAWLPTGLLLGGALGNVADRIREGAVVDFLKLPFDWPAFNLADVSITVGVVLLVLVVEVGARRGVHRPA